jgi:nitroreductase
MDVYEAIQERRSVRKYKPTPIQDGAVQRIFGAVRRAPSTENLQPWKFVLVRDEDAKIKVAAACPNAKWIVEAPVIVVACGLLDDAEATIGGYMNSYPVDVAFAMAYLSLAALEEGLSTCWLAVFSEERVKDALGIPEGVRVLGVTPLGLANEEPAPTGRKQLTEIVSYDKFG